ncbi:UNKNOWN [Stylonychia lemnae]|uniref:Uncharacterized protein n=1 Tax=Stylonychia lemnae TaxID=5949 RepID=A0A078A566_STYLE|nr:UNKNOWN [Stylonychia lemnae]|eukprot:CDW77019.1 UNKNOWN [Stylonychia lemnae]
MDKSKVLEKQRSDSKMKSDSKSDIVNLSTSTTAHTLNRVKSQQNHDSVPNSKNEQKKRSVQNHVKIDEDKIGKIKNKEDEVNSKENKLRKRDQKNKNKKDKLKKRVSKFFDDEAQEEDDEEVPARQAKRKFKRQIYYILESDFYTNEQLKVKTQRINEKFLDNLLDKYKDKDGEGDDEMEYDDEECGDEYDEEILPNDMTHERTSLDNTLIKQKKLTTQQRIDSIKENIQKKVQILDKIQNDFDAQEAK